jgi:uncharacterized protein YutE (UPF0331/DUF86 family)
MTSSHLRATTVLERIAWISQMLADVRSLPLADFSAFQADPRNVAAAESYLRRGLEALLDLGRHLLAKGFGLAVTEYKEIAVALVQVGVLDQDTGHLLRDLAGYRNRLVHFYDAVSDHELYDICATQLGDVEKVLAAMVKWIREHPQMIDRTI